MFPTRLMQREQKFHYRFLIRSPLSKTLALLIKVDLRRRDAPRQAERPPAPVVSHAPYSPVAGPPPQAASRYAPRPVLPPPACRAVPIGLVPGPCRRRFLSNSDHQLSTPGTGNLVTAILRVGGRQGKGWFRCSTVCLKGRMVRWELLGIVPYEI